MCCFAQPVRDVSNTQIFACLTGNGTPFVVYRMDYRSDAPNAMILPLPVSLPTVEDAVRFLSLENHQEFFQTLEIGFHALRSKWGTLDRAMPMSVAMNAAAPRQAVQQVGSIRAWESWLPNCSCIARWSADICRVSTT
jgi:hypothetical protein